MIVNILLLIKLELASTENLAAVKKGLLRKNHFLAIKNKVNLTSLPFQSPNSVCSTETGQGRAGKVSN